MGDEENVLSDEAIAEQEKEAEVAELRTKVVSELGIEDNDANKELIDKLVTRESGLRKGFGTLLGKYKGLKKTTVKPAQQQQSQQANPIDADTVRKEAEASVTARLEQRDLEEMALPEDIESEVKKLAQIKGISVRKAAQDPYITHLIERAVAENRITDAAIPGTRRAAPVAKTESAQVPKFDMSTEEGRKAFDAWKANKGK